MLLEIRMGDIYMTTRPNDYYFYKKNNFDVELINILSNMIHYQVRDKMINPCIGRSVHYIAYEKSYFYNSNLYNPKDRVQPEVF